MTTFGPTIDVCGFEVPLSAYWRIIELWKEGNSTQEIVDKTMPILGPRYELCLWNIVFNIVDNQLRMRDNQPVDRPTLISKRFWKQGKSEKSSDMTPEAKKLAARARQSLPDQKKAHGFRQSLVLPSTLEPSRPGRDQLPNRLFNVSVKTPRMQALLQRYGGAGHDETQFKEVSRDN